MKKLIIQSKTEEIKKALDFFDTEIHQNFLVSKKDFLSSRLTFEESLGRFISVAKEGSYIAISIFKGIGTFRVKISSRGSEIGYNTSDLKLDLDNSEWSDDEDQMMRDVILRSFGNKYKYSFFGGINKTEIEVGNKNQLAIIYTVFAIILAFITAFLAKTFASEQFLFDIDNNIFSPIKQIFINALSLVTAPVFFFSVVSCFKQFNSIRDIGKIGKVSFMYYIFTSFAAAYIGINIFLNNGGFFEYTISSVNISLAETLIGAVPTNIIEPFSTGNTRQLIFMALFCGIAVGTAGEYSKAINDFSDALETMFNKMAILMLKFLPIVAFSSVISTIINRGFSIFIDVGKMVYLVIIGLIYQIILYSLLLLIFGKVSPIRFFRNYFKYMIENFKYCNAGEAMPNTLKACKKMGISPRISSITIPFGATINLDGSCIYFAICGLFLASIYNIGISRSALITLMFAIVALSIGAMCVPGAQLLCLPVLLAQLNVPVDAISLIMGVDIILDVLCSSSNIVGDVVCTLVVASQEKKLDKSVFYSKDK